MWHAIRELMEQFEEAVIVLDVDGEIACVNQAAKAQLLKVGSVEGASGVRVLRAPKNYPVLHYEEPLVLSLPHLDHASSQLPVLLCIRSLEKYLYISPTHEKIYGEPPDALFENANRFLSIVHPEDQFFVEACLEADRSGSPQEYECRALHPDGGYRKLRIRVNPFVDTASGQLLIASLTEDITDFKPLEPGASPKLPEGQSFVSMTEFRRCVSRCIDQWSSVPQAPFFAVAFIDLARFRSVNDSFGYSSGDKLLELTALRISQAIPARNIATGFGSDRFGLLIRSCGDAAQAEALIRSVLVALSVPVSIAETTIQMGARAGLAYPRGMDCTMDMLFRNADAALQLAKRRRESLVVSTISRAEKSMEQATLEFDLTKALDNDEFFFEFQPAFNPSTGEVKMLEALVRWRHPRLGVISPASFISLAEDSGLVLRLDMQGLERLARQIDYWRATYPAIVQVPISINISGRHFPNFVLEKQFHRILQMPALRESNIVFEITESVFVDSNPQTAGGLERLRELGVQIWLDDFGDGYSSFRYLAHFPVDGIKISESFVKQCAKEEKSRVILSSLQTLARGLGVDVVVEGVENREQFETLHTMGFEAVQGYYLSKPLATKDIPQLFTGAVSPNLRHKYPA